jgi:hypothetical protein
MHEASSPGYGAKLKRDTSKARCKTVRVHSARVFSIRLQGARPCLVFRHSPSRSSSLLTSIPLQIAAGIDPCVYVFSFVRCHENPPPTDRPIAQSESKMSSLGASHGVCARRIFVTRAAAGFARFRLRDWTVGRRWIFVTPNETNRERPGNIPRAFR